MIATFHSKTLNVINEGGRPDSADLTASCMRRHSNPASKVLEKY
jgi:hypothetical protein